MFIKTWIKYTEGYVPPKCRKTRYRKCEEYINVELAQVSLEQLQLAFEDNSFQGRGKIYLYNGKLWYSSKKQWANYSIKTLAALKERHLRCSTFFGFEPEDTRERQEARATDAINKYLYVGKTLYIQCPEPFYCINTFGLGHNHGGTGLFVDYHYNENISHERYFSSLDGDKAVVEANRIAQNRGDTKSVGTFAPYIKVHMPEIVTINPKEQHGHGNEFLNLMSAVTQSASDSLEAGLLCMSLATAQMRGD